VFTLKRKLELNKTSRFSWPSWKCHSNSAGDWEMDLLD